MRPEIDEPFLVGWQDQLFATAKRCLRKDGQLTPYVWMLTYPELLVFGADDPCKLMPLAGSPGHPTQSTEKLAIACLPINYGDQALHDIIVNFVLNEEGKRRAALAEAVLMKHPSFDEKKMHRIMVKGTLEANGFVEADLIAIYIREMLKKTNALAYVKQDDSWHLQLKDDEERADHPVSLADDPSAQECILSIMEWAGGMRVITQPYVRRGNRRGGGKVKSFTEPLIKKISREEPDEYSGRFAWMLERNKPASETA